MASVFPSQTITGTVQAAQTISGTAYVIPSAQVKCDEELSETSTQPVQNKVVTAALASKVARADSMTAEQVRDLFHF